MHREHISCSWNQVSDTIRLTRGKLTDDSRPNPPFASPPIKNLS